GAVEAGRDHAAAGAVFPLKHLGGVALVAPGDRAVAHHQGPQAGPVAAAAPDARRALARGTRAHEPAVSPRARAVFVAWFVLEVVLHRRGRWSQDLGTLLAAAAAQARDRGGTRVAGGTHGPARLARRHLPRYGQLDRCAAPARPCRRSPAGPGTAEGNRGARGGARRRALLPAVSVTDMGHLARRERADRERSRRRSSRAREGGRVDAQQPDPCDRRLAGEAAA